MTSDKRRAKRLSVELPVTAYLFDTKINRRLGDPVAGLIKDFSPVGAALTLATIMFSGKHLFYTCKDNPDIVLELAFELGESPEIIITVPAAPVWFDRELDSETKQFVVGVKFLMSARSQEIKTISKEAGKDEKRLVALWKKLF